MADKTGAWLKNNPDVRVIRVTEDIVERLREWQDSTTIPVREAIEEIESLRDSLYRAYREIDYWYRAYLRSPLDKSEPPSD